MRMEIGKVNTFTVESVEKDGYLLKHPDATLKLPKKEATQPLEEGASVDAFVYIVHKKGLQVTMKRPSIAVDRAGFVRVVERKFGLGVFVDIGLSKDMLVSKDDLPPLKKQWPKENDMLLCELKVSRNQIVARPVQRFRLFDALRAEAPLNEGDTVSAHVVYLADEGLVLFTEMGHEIFVYYKHTRKTYRLGEALSVRITVAKDALRYNGTLLPGKGEIVDDDAARILEYLREEGSMPFTDKSAPEEIFNTFHMSKAAFKRALGRLYKEGYVELEKHQTRLKND